MSGSEIRLQSGKAVRLGEAFEARSSELVGREIETRKIIACWISNGRLPLSPLLIGDPGLGKNRIVYECATLCAKNLYIYQGHQDVSAEDLICAVRFSDDPDRKMDYILSPIATAMLTGAVCFIDEIGKIGARALAPLASLLDERRYIDSNLLGERIHAHPGFRFIAATNISDLEGDTLPDFIRSRLRPVIDVAYPTHEEIEGIVRSSFHSLNNNGMQLFSKFWSNWEKTFGEKPPTPRDAKCIFGLALNFADFEAAGDRPYNLESAGHATLSPEHIEQAFEAFAEERKEYTS
jgi:MoxR-like ATPase